MSSSYSTYAPSFYSDYKDDALSTYDYTMGSSSSKANTNQNTASQSKRWLPKVSLSSTSKPTKSSTTTTNPQQNTQSYIPISRTSTAPLNPSSRSQSQPPRSSPTPSSSKKAAAWTSTKKFLSSLGEPPTAEYDRQQALKAQAEGKIRTTGRDAFGAVNYGPWNSGGPFSGKV